jgi:predicted ArsR family transcriptional regulator
LTSSLEGTRPKILAILRQEASATVDQLAQDTGLAPATVRRHLDILQRDRLVSFHQLRNGRGHPEFSYSLTEDGLESGHRDYRGLLLMLLSTVRSLDPADLAGRAGEDLLQFLILRMADLTSHAYGDSEDLSPERRISHLTQALAEGGFSPEVSRENGLVHIRLCNCPFRAAALCEESVCCFDQRLIANILGVEPAREHTIRNGDTSCSYVAPLEG